MSSKKALVLSSGGVDSTTCVAMAVARFGKENVSTLSVYYGQKHSKELKCASDIAAYYGLAHYEIDLSCIMQYSKTCALLKGSEVQIQEKSYDEQIRESNGMVNTYVPFRNGLLLSSVAALAVSIYPDEEVSVYLGAHADDAAGNAYADCSEAFTNAMKQAIYIGTYNKVTVECPLVNWNKSRVVKEGLALNAPYHLTWSCYNGRDKACGKCGTCIDRLAAFKANGVADPISYEN